MRKLFVFAALCVSLIGSSTSVNALQKTASEQPPLFDIAEYQRYGGSGDDQVVGRVVVDTKMFGPVTFANAKVYLFPLTPYGVWWVHVLGDNLSNNEHGAQYAPALRQFTRVTSSDAEGYFSFNNLPAGSYLVTALTDYEDDAQRVETRTVYTMSDDDWPSSYTTQHVRTKLRRELDEVAAKGEFTEPHERLEVTTFSIVGSWTCCRGEL